jgi:hypothetical protein
MDWFVDLIFIHRPTSGRSGADNGASVIPALARPADPGRWAADLGMGQPVVA